MHPADDGHGAADENSDGDLNLSQSDDSMLAPPYRPSEGRYRSPSSDRSPGDNVETAGNSTAIAGMVII